MDVALLALIIGGLFILVVGLYLAYQTMVMKKRTLKENVGVVVEELNPTGQVKVHGEIWSARSVDGNIPEGQKVMVLERKGLNIKVRKLMEGEEEF